MVYCFKSASLRSNEQVPSLKLRTLGAKLGNRLDLTQKLHQKCRETLPPFHSFQAKSLPRFRRKRIAFMLEAENGGHNAWWQALNKHWTNIEQTLNKPCSNPSNEVCRACQTTHEYEKRKSDREIERRHYLDEMLPLLKKGTFDGQKTTLLYKKSESWFASALLLATNR